MAAAISSPVSHPVSGTGLLEVGPTDAPETVLFLHGWGGSKELWREALRRLPGGVRGLALDLPGTGGTPLPPKLKTMADMACWVAETCRRLRLPTVTLVGHSLGGNLAAQAALDFPGLVRRLALVDAALDPAILPRRAGWPLSPRYGLASLRLMRWTSRPLAAAGRHFTHCGSGGYWADYARRTFWFLEANPDPHALQVQLQALTSNPLLPARLTALSQPVLILHGKRDKIVPVAAAHRLARELPEAGLRVFPTAQHCPMDTDPAGFAEALQEFLGSHSHSSKETA